MLSNGGRSHLLYEIYTFYQRRRDCPFGSEYEHQIGMDRSTCIDTGSEFSIANCVLSLFLKICIKRYN